jgi:hypothetical protein
VSGEEPFSLAQVSIKEQQNCLQIAASCIPHVFGNKQRQATVISDHK